MPPTLNPLKRFFARRFRPSNSEKLYGAIVAQARLPDFYRSLQIPDSLEGRFGILALNLFAVLHALADREPDARGLAQELVDRFTQDMEIVLRELGVGDLAIPKRVRALATSSRALLETYASAYRRGEAELAAAIEAGLPVHPGSAGLSSGLLASYVSESTDRIRKQPLSALAAGQVDFANIPAKP